MRINTNIASMTAQEASANTNKSMSSSLEKLGSGLRINKAADDASGLAIADKLRTQASSLGQGISNANSASALIQIADKAMSEQSNLLDTVKQKLIQAGTATTNADGREAIRKDINKLLTQFDNIASQTNYNGTTLLQKSATDTAVQDQLDFQLGEDKTFDVSIQSSKASNTAHLGGGSDSISTGAIAGASGTTNQANNIGVASGQKFNASTAVTLSSVNVSNDGAEVATSGLDIYLSGNVGEIKTAEAGYTLDFSSETDALKATMSLIAQSDTTNYNYTASTGVFSMKTATSLDLTGLNLSNVNLVGATNGADNITLNVAGVADTEFMVKNNNTDTTRPLFGQLNITSGTATGGRLLSDLKDLAADGLTAELANRFMATIDEALTQMNANRSDFGSTQNQLESSIRNMQTTQTNLKNAESVIRDVDYASESANFNKQNIIAQAGTYAMSQANAMQQNVQRLLQ